MTLYLPGLTQVRKAQPSVGSQGPITPQQNVGPSPVQLAVHQQPADKVLVHMHSGHPEDHPIALRHSKAHMDAYHPAEDKLVQEFMGLADRANEGKALPEHMGRMDAIKMELAQIQNTRRNEVSRMNQFMQQSVNADEQSAGPGVQRAGGLPAGATKKDINNQVADANSSSSRGMQTTAQLSTVSGGWGTYSNGLSYQQKALDRAPGGRDRPTIPMQSDWSSEPQIGGTVTRQPGQRVKIGAQSNMAAESGNIQPIQPMKPPQPAAQSQGMSTAKPAQSVFAKAESKAQPVTEAVASIAPGEDPETTSGKATQRKSLDLNGARWGRQTPIYG